MSEKASRPLNLMEITGLCLAAATGLTSGTILANRRLNAAPPPSGPNAARATRARLASTRINTGLTAAMNAVLIVGLAGAWLSMGTEARADPMTWWRNKQGSERKKLSEDDNA